MMPQPEGALSLGPYLAKLREVEPAPVFGHVTRVVGLVVESQGPRARVGDVCELRRAEGGEVLPVEVVGFRDGRLLSVPLGDTAGIRPGDRIVARGGVLPLAVGDGLLGRVIDGLGRPLDGARSAPWPTTARRCSRRRSTRSTAIRSSRRSAPACAPSTPCSRAAAASASASSAAAASARARCSA